MDFLQMSEEQLWHAKEALEKFSRETKWESQHYEELIEQYPNKWIAIDQQQVVAVEETVKEVIVALKRQGLNPAETLIEFLDPDPPTLILSYLGSPYVA